MLEKSVMPYDGDGLQEYPQKSPWRLVPKIRHFPVFCPSHFWQNVSKLHLTFANFSKICLDFGNRPSGAPKCVWTAGFSLLRAQKFYTSTTRTGTQNLYGDQPT